MTVTPYRTGEVIPEPEALAVLGSDVVIAELVERFGLYRYTLSVPLFALVRAVVGQRISDASARAVFARLLELTPLEPQRILEQPDEALRGVGLPIQKVRTIKGIAAFALEGGLEPLPTLSDAEAIAHLSSLHGVGVWTAEMVLLFSLGRPDVWPLGDLGLVRAGERLYPGVDPRDLGERFRPHRSAALWYLWQFILSR